MIFSRDTNFKDKIQAIFNSPELYEAEGLDDLMNNASKTKCPFYKSSRSLNKKTFLENKPYMFYFSEGALIRNNFLFGELKKEENSEYIYKLNVRDNKKSLDINVFDWAGLYFAKQKIVDEGNLEYLKETCPTQYLMLQEEKLSAKQTKEECEAAEMSFFIILNPNKRAEFERLQKELIIEAEKLQKKELRGLMPPFMSLDIGTLKEDFKQPAFIGSLYSFYSHKDGKLYLFSYSKNAKRKKIKQEEYSYDWKPAFNAI